MDKKRIIQNKTEVIISAPAKNKLQELKDLVARFSDNIDQYVSNNYDEAKTRVDFIDKFFELLDWDLSNKQGFSEAYRDVIREDKIRIEGNQKAPDYCFKIGVERKFFVEAKKPSVNIKDDIGAAYQLRRYAYSAKLPLSILTDFHELAVYDTRIKPKPRDKAEVARIFYCKFDEYEQNFDYLYNTFSKNAILKGSFDRYVADTKKKKGTSEVDKEFLKLIENWRNDLAKNIAINNIKLDLYGLNTAVQKIIDRIIFLRIAEARNIEPEDTLSNIAESSSVYKKLDAYFQQSDTRYNSGLFHIENWLSGLKIDDKILKDIIKSTYYPESPYEFSVLPVEILGNIYEQFLGKVIHLTASHQAKIEEKPEVKKAGGVYYTPQYIVDYIVKNTVGEKLKASTPEKVEKLKICDPACGSGSFLLGAYAYLLRWHLDYYTKDKKALEKYKKAGKIYDYKGDFKLTIDEKRKILTNNIFGVDIDSQAVEVTKLSLLLKLMEDETQQSAGMLIKYSKEALLPDLSDNIKCGNSLIGTDFYAGQNMSLFGNDEMRKVNAFDWEKQFKDIFSNGGFDVVIGNPPYVNIRNLTETLSDEEKNYLLKNFRSAFKGFDYYVLFIERAIGLLRERGLFGYIIPNKISTLDYAEKIREILLRNVSINEIDDISNLNVFQNVGVYPYLLFFEKLIKQNNEIKVKIVNTIENLNSSPDFNLRQSQLLKNKGYLISLSNSQNSNYDGKNYIPLSEVGKLQAGITGFSATIAKEAIEDNISKGLDFIVTGNIDRYFLKYGDVRYMNIRYENPKINYKEGIITNGKWELFKSPKIVIGGMTKRIEATYDEVGVGVGVGVYCLNDFKLSPYYILGILNSTFISNYFREKFKSKHLAGGYLAINKGQLAELPIKIVSAADKKELQIQENIINQVKQMIEVQKKFHSAKTEADKKLYQQKIEILDKQIDGEVYKLYGLTPEEIKIVEGQPMR